MPGPMSVPNGEPRRLVKFAQEGVVWFVEVGKLTGYERAYLAKRDRLTTGKTAKKKGKR